MPNGDRTDKIRVASSRSPMPERFRRIMDRVMDFDREWFLAHPEHDRFVRDLVPGEFLNENADANMTLVTNFGVHGRIRAPILEIAPSRNGYMSIFEPSGREIVVPVVRLGQQKSRFGRG
jgi:hypothetical protein